MRVAAHRVPVLLAAAATALAGCSGGGGGSSSRTERLSHAWELQSGEMFESIAYGAGEVRWLILRDDGTGEMLTRRPVSGATGCTDVFFQVLDGDVLEIQIPALGELDFAPAFGKGSSPSSWLAAWEISGAELTLTDAYGVTAVFAKSAEDDITAAERCEDPLALTDIPLPVEPREEQPVFGSDGTSLWYATGIDDSFRVIHTGFDPATGTTAGTVAIDLPELFAWQGADVWAGYASGHNQRLARLTPPTYSEFSSVDSVDTLYDLQNEVAMGNALLDSAQHLWMAGRELGFERTHILVIDTAPEPDVMVSDLTLDAPLQAIALRGSELWALQETAGPMLVRLDPGTGAALRNVKLPGDRWDFVTSLGGEIYLHAYAYETQQHSFVRISLP